MSLGAGRSTCTGFVAGTSNDGSVDISLDRSSQLTLFGNIGSGLTGVGSVIKLAPVRANNAVSINSNFLIIFLLKKQKTGYLFGIARSLLFVG
jgi:hypothetical protein